MTELAAGTHALALQRNRRTWLLAALAILAALLLAVVLRPLAGALFAAGVLAAALERPHRWLSRRLGQRRSAAAAILTTGAVVGIAGPVLLIFLAVAAEVERVIDRGIYIVQQEGVEGLERETPPLLRPLARAVRSLWPDLELVVEAAAKLPKPDGTDAVADEAADRGGARPTREKPTEDAAEGANVDAAKDANDDDARGAYNKTDAATGQALATGAKVAAHLVEVSVELAIDSAVALVALFMLLAHGEALVHWTIDHLPLSSFQTRRMLVELRTASNGIFASTFAVSAIQTLVATIGFLLAGVPHLLLFCAVTFLAGLFGFASPMVGLFGVLHLLTSEVAWGLFLLGWAFLPVNLVENIARPWLARRWVRVPSSIVFLTLVGGVIVFGPLGLLAGPLIVALFRATMRMFSSHVAHLAPPVVPPAQGLLPTGR